MKYRAKVEVSLKPGHSDPEGETVTRLLKELGYEVGSSDVSKVYRIVLDAESAEDARAKAEEMSRRVLANPTKDSFTIHVEELR